LVENESIELDVDCCFAKLMDWRLMMMDIDGVVVKVLKIGGGMWKKEAVVVVIGGENWLGVREKVVRVVEVVVRGG
jgi:hypothetical protein